ncbi:GNAT family N-acetyltransferase [Muricauda sp. JGD-17]|uniref:GNAT family N-acetyltransferase n=1 Tax=Flagellimonas ochracea TaxID=2696472 RepID=A0A964WWL2_9FLAO|nr:GNAT family N-acetyltransferase [Allomuricauda ochracea]NAY91105.1 GNAT family N-acetyltransferase [Allomuricauda ochracea]
MRNYKVEIGTLRVSDYQELRASTNWANIRDEVVKAALENDLFSICVFDNSRAIGIGRIIGDGAIYFYIQDVIVLPEYQGKGVGKLIMENIENYLIEKTSKNSFVGLMAAEGVGNFYKQFGYLKRPNSRPGMYKIIKK